MASTEGFNNMERFYEQQADDALNAFNSGRYDIADQLCTKLLLEPKLPVLWRAQCNLLLATKGDNTSAAYAKDAAKYYDEMLVSDPDDDYLRENRREAQLLIDAAEAARAKETADVTEGTEAAEGAGEGAMKVQQGGKDDLDEEEGAVAGSSDARDAAHPRAIKSLQSSSGRSSRAATVVPGSLKTVVQAKEDSQTKKNADEEEGDDHQKI